MSDGAISIKLAQDYQMASVAQEMQGESENLLINEPFFPDISVSQFRARMRTDGTITPARVEDALIEAIASVNDELAEFYAENQHYGELAQIPAQVINHESVLVSRYRRAVYCLALANLYERYTSYDTTNDGEKKAALLKSSIDELRRDARFAISDLLKRRRIDVELI